MAAASSAAAARRGGCRGLLTATGGLGLRPLVVAAAPPAVSVEPSLPLLRAPGARRQWRSLPPPVWARQRRRGAATAAARPRGDGGPQSSLTGAEWRLYTALDKRDEASHVALARFVSEFEELLATASASLDTDKDGVVSPEEIASVGGDQVLEAKRVLQVKGASRSFRLAETVTPQRALDVLKRSVEGDILAAADLQRLLRQASAALLEEPAVRRLPAPTADGESVVVVGDLHGSISDLSEVIRLCGPPDQTTYVFNGDFVDRGRHGVEVVASLCALKLAFPDRIFLNRGNHECKNLSRVYGLEKEVRSKYRGPIAQKLFDELGSFFSALPWAVVVGGQEGDIVAALIVHGGLPSDANLATLAAVGDRTGMTEIVQKKQKPGFFAQSAPDEGETTEIQARKEKRKRLLEDLVWSDPDRNTYEDFVIPNELRKAGNHYGLGAVRSFLQREGLRTLVRSHEVVRSGLEWLDCGGGTEMYTVFSSSNYPDKRGANQAAAIRFRPRGAAALPPAGPRPRRPDVADEMRVSMDFGVDPDEGGHCDVEVFRWQTDAADEPATSLDTTTFAPQAKACVQSLGGMIARHRGVIMEACERAEVQEASQRGAEHRRGYLSLGSWSQVLALWSANVGFALPSVDWQALLPLLAAGVGGPSFLQEVPGYVDYQRLFAGYNLDIVSKDGQPLRGGKLSSKDIMSLYANHSELSVIFAWMDVDSSGTLSLEEVRAACEVLNARAAQRGAELVDADALFRAMDIDGSGSLDISEFMECFRLAGAA